MVSHMNSTVVRLHKLLITFKSLVILTLGWRKISNFVSTKEEVTASEVLTEALDLDPRQQARREARRVADCLQTLNWRRRVTTRKDKITGKSKSVRIWARPKDDPLPEDHILKDF